MKNKWIYGLALFFALLTTYFLYGFLNSVEKKVSQDATEGVVCLEYDITPQTLLTREMLIKKHLPEEYIHAQAIRSLEEAVGSISLTSFVKGEQLLKSKVASQGDIKNGLAYLIPVGKRAISIPVDEVSGVAGLLKPGNRVDVAAVLAIPDKAQEETIASLIVLQDIVVLAVGKNMEEKAGKLETESNAQKTVTLAVTLEEAKSLLLASQKGNIRLLLRSPVDNTTVNTRPFKAQDFVQ